MNAGCERAHTHHEPLDDAAAPPRDTAAASATVTEEERRIRRLRQLKKTLGSDGTFMPNDPPLETLERVGSKTARRSMEDKDGRNATRRSAGSRRRILCAGGRTRIRSGPLRTEVVITVSK